MKLYFSPGACSLSPHIALREAGLSFDLEQVDLAKKTTKSGGDFRQVSPKGYVPALVLDDGNVLTEGPAIVQWIADRKPESKLAPPNGSFERYRLQEWLNFISTEIHKSFSPLFNPRNPEEVKQASRDRIAQRLDFVEPTLSRQQYLLGDSFTVADAYLFTVLRWSGFGQIDLTKWPGVKAYFDRIATRPAVRAALDAEGQK